MTAAGRCAIVAVLLQAASALQASAQVIPSPLETPCFASNVNAALNRVRSEDPSVEQMLREIAARGVRCFVTEQYDGRPETRTHSEAGKFSIEIAFPGKKFAQDPSGGRWPDGSCNTFDATLVHEVFHCWNRAVNNGNEDGDYEAAAVKFENTFRRRTGLCNRTKWNYAASAVTEPSNCDAPDLSCGPVVDRCNQTFCCAVYGGITYPDGSWGTCLIPNLTADACRSLTVPGKSSAGERDNSVCTNPNQSVQFCGGSGK